MDPITSFDDASAEALLLDNLYEDTVRFQLASYPWRFAMKQVQLSRSVSTPLEGNKGIYTIPGDALVVRSVSVNGVERDFDRYDDVLYVDASADEVVIGDYTYRALVSKWPSYFVLPVIHLLAAELGSGVAHDGQLFDLMMAKAESYMRRAQTRESQDRTAQKVSTSRFFQARSGSRF